MKSYFLLSALAGTLFMASCGNNNTATETTTTAPEHTSTTTPAVAGAAIDPICNMEKGADWTEFTVKGTDTTWFCSPHCKETFDKNPEKYATTKAN
jgi:YHS domain-containing protein